MRRVVITGMGVISSVGTDVDEFWNSIKLGKTGISPIESFDTSAYKVKLAGEVKNFSPDKFGGKKFFRRMERFSQFALAASIEAIRQSGFSCGGMLGKEMPYGSEDPYRIGVIIGNGLGSVSCLESNYNKIRSEGCNKCNPLMIPLTISNMAAGNVSIAFGLKGKSMCISSACATSAHSIGEAFRSIKYNDADIMVCGGTETIITESITAGFQAMKALSFSDDIHRASIPFDKDRTGFVMGEGAGILVLEELEHAKRRNAVILAEVAGYGATSDAFHITSPDESGEGAAAAMKSAMKDAEISPSDIDYINAHGTGTHHNDLFETRAVHGAFGKAAEKISISSTKSYIGHLLGAAGAVEAIVCVKSILDSYIHPTINLREEGEGCDLDYTKGKGRAVEVNTAMSNSLGFGGHNASLIFKKYVD